MFNPSTVINFIQTYAEIILEESLKNVLINQIIFEKVKEKVLEWIKLNEKQRKIEQNLEI